jgi:hypothetical protein
MCTSMVVMECPECARLKTLLSEALADRAKSSASAGNALRPVNVENTADLGARLHLALSEVAVTKSEANLARHVGLHQCEGIRSNPAKRESE